MSTGFRADIQGLRAIAVLLVLAFHLFPDRVAGGFVGVDVFFVISGFLITGHLLGKPPQRWRDVVDFWGRRLRRLLPASLLVIVVTVLAASIVLPATRLRVLGGDTIASALYVENWRLAATAVDYLSNRAAPSPLQHYWSLGVEEQFYLLWPILVGLLGWLALRTRSKYAIVIGLAVFVAASLVVSVAWTAAAPEAAYFVTPTRLWELAAGGLLAALLPLVRVDPSPRIRAAAAWGGLALIAAAVVLFDAETAFPGILAAVPVVGACLFIAANSNGSRLSPNAILRVRPVQLVGDASYSIYLWHFPVIVLATYAVGGNLTLLQKVPVVIACLAIAQLSKVFVEDPARRSAWLRVPRRTWGAAALATGLVVTLSLVPAARIEAAAAEAAELTAQAIEANEGCFGAAALAVPGCAVTSGSAITPSTTLARDDVTSAYDDGCVLDRPYATVVRCEYGDTTEPAFRIALVGNSHSAHWLPALEELAGDESYSITTYLALGCLPTTAELAFSTTADIEGCHDWARSVVDETASGGFDLVVISAGSVYDLVGVAPEDRYDAELQGYLPMLATWADAGTHVLAIRDTPIPNFDVPDCIATHGGDHGACDGSPSQWLAPDPLVGAIERAGDPELSVVDLDDRFCSPTTCFVVIGGVLVYTDDLHFSATFSRTLAPYLGPAVRAALAPIG